MADGLIYVSLGSADKLNICDHVSINARKVTEDEFDKGRHEYMVLECNQCNKEIIVGIVVN